MNTNNSFNNFSSFERQLVLDLESPQFSMALSADGRILVTGGEEDRTIRVWDAQTGQLIRSWAVASHSFSRDENRIYSLSLSFDKKILVTGGSLLQVWNLTTGQLIRTLKGGGWALYTILSPDGKRLVTYDEEKTVVWNLETGKKIRKRFGDNNGIETIIITPDSEFLVGGDSFDHSIKIWNLKTGQVIRKVVPSSAVIVRRLAVSPNGQLLAGSGFNGIQLWDYETGNPLQTINKFSNLQFYEHLENVGCPVFSSNGKAILSCGNDGFVQIWNTDTGRNINTLKGQHRVASIALSADNQILVAYSRIEYVFEIWRVM